MWILAIEENNEAGLFPYMPLMLLMILCEDNNHEWNQCNPDVPERD